MQMSIEKTFTIVSNAEHDNRPPTNGIIDYLTMFQSTFFPLGYFFGFQGKETTYINRDICLSTQMTFNRNQFEQIAMNSAKAVHPLLVGGRLQELPTRLGVQDMPYHFQRNSTMPIFKLWKDLGEECITKQIIDYPNYIPLFHYHLHYILHASRHILLVPVIIDFPNYILLFHYHLNYLLYASRHLLLVPVNQREKASWVFLASIRMKVTTISLMECFRKYQRSECGLWTRCIILKASLTQVAHVIWLSAGQFRPAFT